MWKVTYLWRVGTTTRSTTLYSEVEGELNEFAQRFLRLSFILDLWDILQLGVSW